MVEVALISVLVKTAKRSYVASLFCPKEIRRCNDTVLVARVVLTPERIADLKPLRPHVIQFLVRRTYTEAELSAAGLLVLTRTAAALVADEATSCYDTSQACHECGSGWSQSRDLELDHRKLAKRAGLVQIVSGEFLVDTNTANRVRKAGLTGFHLRPILHTPSGSGVLNLRAVPSGRELYALAEAAGVHLDDLWVKIRRSRVFREVHERAVREHHALVAARESRRTWPQWFQMVATGEPVALVTDKMRFGVNPLDKGPACRPGHSLGWNVLSETYVHRTTWSGADYCVSQEVYGMHEPERESSLYPVPVTLVSQAFYRVMKDVKGTDFEAAHLL